MKTKLLIIYIFCLLIAFPTSFGQISAKKPHNLRVKSYTSEDGLSQVVINDLIKDKLGFSWIATEGGGLDRFDGTRFKNYSYVSTDSTSISGNAINCLFEDSKGNIWIGTLGNGLNRYNRDTDNFTRIKLNGSKESETISDIVEDTSGKLWVSTRDSGLYSFSISQNELRFNEQNRYLNNTPLSGLYLDNQEILWIGGRKGEVFRVNINLKSSFVFEKVIEIVGSIYTIYKKDDKLLLGSEKGLFIYDLTQAQLTELSATSSPNNIGFVSTFLEEDDKNIWVGTGNGLYLFDWTTLELNPFIENNKEDQFNLSSNSVYGLAHISDSKLLVGTTNGFYLLDFSEPYFYNISHDKKGKHLLNDNNVMTVLEESDRLWVGTSDKGLNLIYADTTFHLITNDFYPKKLKGASIMDLKLDSINRRLWIATSRGLAMIKLTDFSPNNIEIEVFEHDENNTNTISADYLTGITIDSKGGVWGSTYGQGIFRLNYLDKGRVEINTINKDSKNSVNNPNSNFLYASVFTDNKTLWLATEAGLSKLTFTDSNYIDFDVQNYFSNDSDQTSISHNGILSFLIDKKSRLWVGTRGGINLYLGNNKFRRFDKDPRIQGPIYTMQEGLNGDIWFGSNNGLYQYEWKKDEFNRYTIDDGLQSNIIGLNASFRDHNETLYFGGPAGLTYFTLDRIIQKNYTTPIYFSGLRMKNKNIGFIDNKLVQISDNKEDNLELKINYDEFPFYINLSKIDYNYYQGANYAFKLLPIDDQWNTIENSTIQFLNLPSGDYTLMVNGFIRGSEMDQPPIKLKLKIIPPWWLSWWAYIIYTLVLGILVYIVYKFNLNRKLAIADSRRARELDEIKSKMYANISHEFRTPLTMIKGLSGQLLKSEKDPKQEKLLKDIDRSNEQLLNLVNQMLDLATLDAKKMEIHYKHGDIVDFLEKCVDLYRSYSDSISIEIEFATELVNLFMDFDDNKLQKIINNLVSNAIKFTSEGGKVEVGIKQKDNMVCIKVSDTGKGIGKDDLPKVFNRHFKTQDIHGSQGNGIGLALTKELVDLLEGTIEVKSKIKEGSVFTVRLPIRKRAIDTDIDHNLPFVSEQIRIDVAQGVIGVANRPTLLVVEDNRDIQNFLVLLLAEHYNIITAENGEEGLRLASSKDIDFIISDVMMPKMDGFEFCERIKADVNTSHIPFIMLSARTATEDKQKAYQLGVDAYMVKPFNQNELLLIIKNLIVKRQERTRYLNELLSLKTTSPRSVEINQLDLDLIKSIQEFALSGQKQSMEDLAHGLGTSRTQLHRKLKQLTGQSITAYINHIRIEKAKVLLKESTLNINEIAYEVGFDSPNYFSKAFKKIVDLSPQEYRNNQS